MGNIDGYNSFTKTKLLNLILDLAFPKLISILFKINIYQQKVYYILILASITLW